MAKVSAHVRQEREEDPLPHLLHLKTLIRTKNLAVSLIRMQPMRRFSRDEENVMEVRKKVRQLFEQVPPEKYINGLINYQITMNDFFTWFPGMKNREFFTRLFPSQMIHCIEPDQSHIPNGKYACTAICIVAAYHFFKLKILFDLKQMNWPKIMEEGASLWREVYVEKGRSQTFFTFFDVYNSKAASEIQQAIQYDTEEFAGHLFSSSFSQEGVSIELEKLLRILLGKKRDAVMIFTVSPFTFAFIYNCLDRDAIWFFDSHGGIEENKLVLIRFVDVQFLTKLLQWKFCNRLTSLNLPDLFSCVTVYSTK